MLQRRIPRCSCRTSRASWSARLRGRRHRQGRRQDGDGGGERQVPKVTLIVGGSSAPATTACAGAPTVRAFCSLAERAHLGDWRRAGGVGAGDRQRDNIEGEGKAGALTRRRRSRRQSRSVRDRGQSVLRHRAAVGRRHHRATGNAARAGAVILGGAECAGAQDEVWGCSGVVQAICEVLPAPIVI